MKKKLFDIAIAIAVIACLLLPSISEAGLIFNRKASGRPTPVRNLGKAAVARGLHPFGGCANGSCGR